MKKKDLIAAIAGCLMLLAYLVMPYVKFGPASVSMYDVLKNDFSIFSLLFLLSSVFLVVFSLREKFGIADKIAVPEMVAFLLPVIFLLCMILFKSKEMKAAMMLASYGIGFYLCVLAAIVVAVLPWVKSPILEEKV